MVELAHENPDDLPMSSAEAAKVAAERQRAAERIKSLIVERLELPMPPDWITDDQPLFGRGLELDSLDALELAVGLEYYLDATIDDSAVGVFGSINSIVDYILANGITIPDEFPTEPEGQWDVDGDLADW